MTILSFKISVTLAIRNRVGSECKFFRIRKVNLALRSYMPSFSYVHMRFPTGMYVLWFLVSALSGVGSMWIQPRRSVCSFFLYVFLALKKYPHLLLNFFQTVRTSFSPTQFCLSVTG